MLEWSVFCSFELTLGLGYHWTILFFPIHCTLNPSHPQIPSAVCMLFWAPGFIIVSTIIRQVAFLGLGWNAISDLLQVEKSGSVTLCSWNIILRLFHGHTVF